jgi:rubredoxin
MEKWECMVCGYIYDLKLGDPDASINPGTKFGDIPKNWTCPECGADKDEFERLEE